MPVVGAFPDYPARRIRYRKRLPDYKSITIVHTFDDEGSSSNTSSDVAPQRWDLEYSFNTEVIAEAAALAAMDAHYNLARLEETFQFTEKDDTIVASVQYEEYEADHDRYISWVQLRRLTLIKRPA